MKSSIFLFSLVILSFLAELSDAKIACPTGFALVNQQKCLKIFPNHLKHLEAELDCTHFGGTLATIHNAIDNRAVSNFAANAGVQNAWIGVFCFENQTTSCYYDDNSGRLSYNNFIPGHPRLDNGYGGCVYMTTSGKNAGQWSSGPCGVVGLAFVCEVPTTVADPTCLHNFNGNCYLPSHELTGSPPNATYSDARGICHSNSAELASIHSHQEVDFIRTIYKDLDFYSVLIGGQVSADGNNVTWVDGSDFDYNYMNPIGQTDGNCLQMNTIKSQTNNGLWSKFKCERINYFLCKRKIGDAVNPKFKSVASIKDKPTHTINLADASHCNSTLFLAPGIVTTLGYPNSVEGIFCTWKIGVLGAYRVGIYFTDFSINGALNIYDEYGNLIEAPSISRYPFQALGPTNLVSMTHDSRYDKPGLYHGFSATILPY
ncbi:hypothetical protein CRE_14503 [Caenorhabditis remanei]|uniref:C-type LECtin n=1 Tax=Caenorhabditis remanei TaxID=31234 RepID=E3M989_CAERE|nr:hypothetical protein CRE_14503 [Caenorhabditis remanei]